MHIGVDGIANLTLGRDYTTISLALSIEYCKNIYHGLSIRLRDPRPARKTPRPGAMAGRVI